MSPQPRRCHPSRIRSLSRWLGAALLFILNPFRNNDRATRGGGPVVVVGELGRPARVDGLLLEPGAHVGRVVPTMPPNAEEPWPCAAIRPLIERSMRDIEEPRGGFAVPEACVLLRNVSCHNRTVLVA